MVSTAPAKLFAARAVKLFTIGQVLNVLSPNFPDLTPSKLRFLEEQGLVTPQRTDSGYRKFTDLDIERIRIVLELQRDQYLPLKVIRAYLAELDEGNIYECLIEGYKHDIRNCWWVVDYNRQSLDAVVREGQIDDAQRGHVACGCVHAPALLFGLRAPVEFASRATTVAVGKRRNHLRVV